MDADLNASRSHAGQTLLIMRRLGIRASDPIQLDTVQSLRDLMLQGLQFW